MPQGAVGRVVGARDGELDVHARRRGRASATRATSWSPRKLGQVRLRPAPRARRGTRCGPCVVLEAAWSARARGGWPTRGPTPTCAASSRCRFRGPLGLVEPPSDLVSTDGSATYWEVGKAVRQALRADPNTLEMLFVRAARGARRDRASGCWRRATRSSRSEIYGSFGRYALSQLEQALAAHQRLAEHRDARARLAARGARARRWTRWRARLAAVARAPRRREADAVLAAKEYIKQLYRSLLRPGPDRGATTSPRSPRYARGGGDVARAAARSAAEERLQPDAPDRDRHPLAARRRGRAARCRASSRRDAAGHQARRRCRWTDVLRDAEAMTPDLEAARPRRAAAAAPRLPRADVLLRRVREETPGGTSRRSLGPLGKDAPPRRSRPGTTATRAARPAPRRERTTE